MEKCLFEEISFRELPFGAMSVRRTARSVNCFLEICSLWNRPSGKCLRGTVHRGKVRWGNVHRRNARRGTVLELLLVPLKSIIWHMQNTRSNKMFVFCTSVSSFSQNLYINFSTFLTLRKNL